MGVLDKEEKEAWNDPAKNINFHPIPVKFQALWPDITSSLPTVTKYITKVKWV